MKVMFTAGFVAKMTLFGVVMAVLAGVLIFR